MSDRSAGRPVGCSAGRPSQARPEDRTEDEREFELKARLEESPDAFRARLAVAGWRRIFQGELRDRRYDTPVRRLEQEDVVLRLRRWRAESEDGQDRAVLGWKGPVREIGGFKVREELEVSIGDIGRAARILARLGFSEVTMAIDRRVDMHRKGPVSVRLEEYPNMDVLVELEGPPVEVEARIPELGLPRAAWRSWALPEFVARFEGRTGSKARLAREGEWP